MFETTNSIEPATPQRARQKEQPIREATSAEIAKLMRREEPVKAARNWFQRTPKAAVEPDSVSRTHGLYVAQKRDTRTYFADYQQKSEVMRAAPAKISSKLSDRQTVTAMLDLVQSRGWDKVNLKGTEEFKREAWVQAQVRGIMTEGHKASDTDKQEVARRKQASGVAEVAAKITTAITSSAPPIAKGWTEAEANKMNDHISAKVGRETVRSEPSSAATRLAERQADPTDRMHDKRREAQADAHKPNTVVKATKAKKNQADANIWGNADKLGAKMRTAEVSKQAATEKSKTAVTA